MGKNKKEKQNNNVEVWANTEVFEPIKKEPVKAMKKEDKKLPEVTIKVFIQVSNIKWDQLAGFQNYIKRQKVKLATIPGWKALYEEYKVKPVK